VDKKNIKKRNSIKDFFSTIIWALIIAFIMRTFIFQPFHIPSSSMMPGLMKGDYIITSKLSVGYGKYAASPIPFPIKNGRLFEKKINRGDVIVFIPEGDNKNFIKRVLALPGEQIQIINGRPVVNGVEATSNLITTEVLTNSSGVELQAEKWDESFSENLAYEIYNTTNNGRLDETSTYTVPAGHYFVMGDNRDNSSDSRVSVINGGAGFVPSGNIVSKASLVLFSVKNKFALLKPWTWLNFRSNRFFKAIL
jgi:signal peptidase I